MKYLPLAAAIIFLAAGGFLIVRETTIPDGYVFYENQEYGFSTFIPKDWSISIEKSTMSWKSDTLKIQSPDYHAKQVSLSGEAGDVAEVVDQGALISKSLSLKGRDDMITESIQTAAPYVEFQASSIEDCSNCFGAVRVNLDGQPALLYRVHQIYYPAGQDNVYITTVHNKLEFNINYTYDSFTMDKKKIIDTFVKYFRFTN